jgi:hypothetical protein
MRAAIFGAVFVVGCNAPPEPEVPDSPPSVDPRVAALFARLNDDPDHLHSDYTPAVHELIRVGRPAIPPALDLMLSEHRSTRLRAQRVLEGVVLIEHGFVFGHGWTRPDGEDAFRAFWKRLGDLGWDDSTEARRDSIDKWRVWLADQQ